MDQQWTTISSEIPYGDSCVIVESVGCFWIFKSLHKSSFLRYHRTVSIAFSIFSVAANFYSSLNLNLVFFFQSSQNLNPVLYILPDRNLVFYGLPESNLALYSPPDSNLIFHSLSDSNLIFCSLSDSNLVFCSPPCPNLVRYGPPDSNLIFFGLSVSNLIVFYSSVDSTLPSGRFDYFYDTNHVHLCNATHRVIFLVHLYFLLTETQLQWLRENSPAYPRIALVSRGSISSNILYRIRWLCALITNQSPLVAVNRQRSPTSAHQPHA